MFEFCSAGGIGGKRDRERHNHKQASVSPSIAHKRSPKRKSETSTKRENNAGLSLKSVAVGHARHNHINGVLPTASSSGGELPAARLRGSIHFTVLPVAVEPNVN